MQTKLTLRLDDELIAAAKAHALRTGRSLSSIVADYFAAFAASGGDEPQMTPVVADLRGMLRGSDLDREDYRRHLEEKYL